MEDEVTFLFQLGVIRDVVVAPISQMTLAYLKELAVKFVNEKIPDNGLNRLSERILLFKHNYWTPNVLEIINSSHVVTDEALIEIVLTANPQLCSGDDSNGECVTYARAHSLVVHSYKAPTFCDFCGEMLFGLVRQGLKCEGCGLNYHKRCAVKVPSTCTASTPQANPSVGPSQRRSPSRTSQDDSLISASRASRSPSRSSTCGSLWAQGSVGIPHTFELHTYTRPTVCSHCKKLLRGLFKQGLQCKDCHYNAHRKCLPLISKDCGGEVQNSHGEYPESIASSELSLPQEDETEWERVSERATATAPATPSSSSSSPSANIPLMRIVQSVRHTKKGEGNWIKEGWLVHCTNKDKTLRRHYWRLDSKCLTLFVNETSSKYYKEIPLEEILTVDVARTQQADAMHCFEIRCAAVDLLVGVEGWRLGSGGGEGAHVATSWRTALRHALVPHAPQPPHSINDMAKEFTIHPDEVLGSGQFGVVYGGLQRTNNKPVAIKVIDKLRFPTKQEAQLKNEVSILQNISHPGVVNLERMFESPERIFVVMEKLKGDMLEMILSHANGRLTERITKFIVAQILVALKHLHEKNIVHCDLKPENVLLSEDEEFPQVKLCDFGFARIIGEKSFRRSVVGTPAYLAPEVLRNKGYNRSLDMWSVGVIIYVSLSGTFPFNEDEDIAEQIQNAAFMYPPSPWREISDEAIDLINSLLQVKQRKRLSVDKSCAHAWLQTREAHLDLRALETRLGVRYLTHETDDDRWR